MSLSLFTQDQSKQPQGSRRRRAYADGELIMDGNASATDKSVPVGKTVWTRRCWDGCIRLAVDARGTGRTSFEDKVTSSRLASHLLDLETAARPLRKSCLPSHY